MAALGTICYALIAPLLADGSSTPIDSGPTWTVAAACAGFLAAISWAIRNILVWSRDGIKVAYKEMGVPIGTAHLELLQTLKLTRETDSKSLAALAADVHSLNQSIRCRHEP